MAYTDLSQDANGWTIFAASAGSRLCYVSDAGNDGTGTYYSPAAIGGDPFLPDANMTNPYKTYAAAVAVCRDGYADWVLFRRGDTFTAEIQKRNGASDTALAVVTAYGASGAMPIIHPVSATTTTLYIVNTFQRFAVMGLDFYHNLRDPDSGDYVGVTGCYGIYFFVNNGETARQVVVEGCKFRFFRSNMMQANTTGTLEDVAFRRNIVLDNYADTGEHSHGLYGERFDTVLVEENIFDHNGWYSKTGPGVPSVYHHNTYIVESHNLTYRNNIIMRAASGQTKMEGSAEAGCTNIILHDNLWIDGEVALSLGTNNSTPATRFLNLTITDNIVTNVDRDNPTERGLGWGFLIRAIDTGTISGNLLMNWANPAVTNTFAMELDQGILGMMVENNIVYELNPNGSNNTAHALFIGTDDIKTGNTIQNNIFQEPSNPIRQVYFEDSADLAGFTFMGNKYYASSEVFRIGSTDYNFAGWVVQSGETGTFALHSFPDPTRNIETYMTYLGETATIAAFIAKCRAQSRYSWDTDYTASVVNNWIRAGFYGDEGDPADAPFSKDLAMIFR